MKSRVHSKYKTESRVTYWASFNQALVRRGSITVWFSSNAIAAWKPVRGGERSGQLRHSDLAIATALTLRFVLYLPFRQAKASWPASSR